MQTVESKLAELVAEAERHRDSLREFSGAGYVTMAERHQRLLKLVTEEIRRHCRAHGLELPPGVSPEED